MAPGGVLLVRPNTQLNLFTLNMRNNDFYETSQRTAPAFIEGIAVQSYEPHSNTMAVRVIRLGVFQGDDPVMTR